MTPHAGKKEGRRERLELDTVEGLIQPTGRRGVNGMGFLRRVLFLESAVNAVQLFCWICWPNESDVMSGVKLQYDRGF